MKKLLIIVVLLVANIASAQTYIPKETKVAIVPVRSITGEKWQALTDKQIAHGGKFLKEEFEKRNFVVIDAETVAQAIQNLKIDFADEEVWKRETLYALGNLLQADLVIFVVITDTDQRLIQQFLVAKREGTATLKVWMVDAKKKEPIVSAKTIKGKSGGGVFAGLDKGSDRQIIAVANGLRDLLKDWLMPYPIIGN